MCFIDFEEINKEGIIGNNTLFINEQWEKGCQYLDLQKLGAHHMIVRVVR